MTTYLIPGFLQSLAQIQYSCDTSSFLISLPRSIFDCSPNYEGFDTGESTNLMGGGFIGMNALPLTIEGYFSHLNCFRDKFKLDFFLNKPWTFHIVIKWKKIPLSTTNTLSLTKSIFLNCYMYTNFLSTEQHILILLRILKKGLYINCNLVWSNLSSLLIKVQ